MEAALGPACALCLAPNGEVLSDKALQAVVLSALSEAVAAAQGCGARVNLKERTRALLALCAQAPKAWHPMAARSRAKKPCGAAKALAPIFAAARKAKAPAPVLGRLVRLLRRLEASR